VASSKEAARCLVTETFVRTGDHDVRHLNNLISVSDLSGVRVNLGSGLLGPQAHEDGLEITQQRRARSELSADDELSPLLLFRPSTEGEGLVYRGHVAIDDLQAGCSRAVAVDRLGPR